MKAAQYNRGLVVLPPGHRLGAYAILGPLGSGGMGEVYRARDTRLDRDVAIKVLPRRLAEDEDALARFEREAKAVAALSHPNILAIHDFSTDGDAPYAVMELLEGETLRQRLQAGAIPARKAAEQALQIARGLAAAHDRGIVHRDLKPENVFVTADGRLKILDFGLAKLEEAPPPTGTDSPTLSRQTEPGALLGTVGYMSPEQVRGQGATARSDIFSFGAVFYEMLSGQRAFQRDTAAETMTAILKEDPPELSQPTGRFSPAAERVVRHCLEKRPEERFRSAHDLAFAVETLTAASSASAGAAATMIGRRRRWWMVSLAVLAVAAAAYFPGMWRRPTRSGASSAPEELPTFKRLTFHRGTIRSARFSSDGQTIAYGAAWDGEPVKVFLTRPGSVWSKTLDLPQAEVLAVSATGEMALSLGHSRLGDLASGTLARVTLLGGPPRAIQEDVREADWAPGGEELAVVRRVGAKERLEFPRGTVLHETDGYVSHIRFSRDGALIAFLDHPVFQDNRGDVAVVDRHGTKRTLSRGWARTRGLAWSPDGREVWFSGDRVGGDYAVFAVDLDGRERTVLSAPATIAVLDVAPDGRVLLGREQQSWEILAQARGEARPRNLSWLDRSRSSDISADGGKVLLTHLGEGSGPDYSVFLRGTDGSPGLRLGEGEARALSPDGRWAAAVLYGPPALVRLLPTGPGETRDLAVEGLEPRDVSWFPDGRRLLLVAHLKGHAGPRPYVLDMEGGPPTALVRHEVQGDIAWGPLSPDGRWVAATALDSGRVTLHPVGPGTPRVIPGEGPGDHPIRWSADGRSLFVLRLSPTRIFRLDLASGRREVWQEITPPDAAGLGGAPQVQVTADGRAWVASHVRSLTDLYLAEGLR